VNGHGLKPFNTLGVPAWAERFVAVTREDDLVDLVQRGEPLTVLGGGSNVVLRRWLPGIVCLIRLRGRRLDEGPDGSVDVTAAAGENWHELVRYCLGQGLVGLENLALIPGLVGAAPIQNIGAYGVELADRLVRLTALDTRAGVIRTLHAADCGFGYRHSVFKTPEGAHWIVLSVTVRLHRHGARAVDYPELQLELARLGWDRPSAVQVAEAVIRVRRRKLPDPRRHGNVGSFFENPEVPEGVARAARQQVPALTLRAAGPGRVKLSAAQLIDACGWKGRSRGAAAVWHRQPLVLVNRGAATGADMLALSEAIRANVAERFGIHLQLEPRVLGQDDSPVFGSTP
jgi:UDP-N-acetylmuramate dehydrogenase